MIFLANKAAKPVMLVFEAHSDDACVGMGGTILKNNNKYHIVEVTMTKGETAYTKIEDKAKMGEIRHAESLASDRIFGVQEHIFLDNPCQDLQNNLKNYHEIVKIIRKYKPAVIYTHKSSDKHRDHRAVHDLVTEGWWKASENVLADYGTAYRTPELYYFEVTDLFEYYHVVSDITSVFSKKIEALYSFKSQLEVLKGLEDFTTGLALVRGYQGGFKYGEAFQKGDLLPTPT